MEEDRELVRRSRAGDLRAFDALMRRLGDEIFAFCRKLAGNAADAEELAQEGFIAAYGGLRGLRDDGNFKNWLLTICLNKFRERKRRQKRESERMDEFRGPEPATPDPGSGELNDIVREKINGLPDRQREVMALHLYRHLSYREIAEALGCAYEDVKVNISLARKRLKEELADYLERR